MNRKKVRFIFCHNGKLTKREKCDQMGYSVVNWCDIANYSNVDNDKTGVGKHITFESFKDLALILKVGKNDVCISIFHKKMISIKNEQNIFHFCQQKYISIIQATSNIMYICVWRVQTLIKRWIVHSYVLHRLKVNNDLIEWKINL